MQEIFVHLFFRLVQTAIFIFGVVKLSPRSLLALGVSEPKILRLAPPSCQDLSHTSFVFQIAAVAGADSADHQQAGRHLGPHRAEAGGQSRAAAGHRPGSEDQPRVPEVRPVHCADII